MRVIVKLDGYLKSYCDNQKVVEFLTDEVPVTVSKIKEWVHIPDDLGVVAISASSIVDPMSVLTGDTIEILLIPPVNGG